MFRVFSFFLFTSLASFCLAYASGPGAPLLIIAASDQHSQYENIENFLYSSRSLVDDFLKKNASGKVLYIVNGDFGGHSLWAQEDLGSLGYEMLKVLSKDFTVLVGAGNHDGFDFKKKNGNKVFYDQNLDLIATLSENSGHPVYLVGSNFNLMPHGQELFRPYQDIHWGAHQKIRFIGGMFEGFFGKSNYIQTDPFQIFGDQLNLQSYLRDQIQQAANDHMSDVVLLVHDGYESLRNQVTQLQDWMATQSTIVNTIHIRLTLAADDHKIYQGQIGESWLIDSGSNYQYTAVYLNERNELDHYQFMDFSDQANLARTVRSSSTVVPLPYAPLVEEIKAHITKVRQSAGMDEVVIPLHFKETKAEFSAGRVPLGNFICDAMVEYGRDELNSELNGGESFQVASQVSEVFGFLESSTFRRVMPLTGPATVADVLSIFPFEEPVQLFDLSGALLQRLYTSYVAFRNQRGLSLPQLSSRLRVNRQAKLEYQSGDQWKALDDTKTYRLVMDHISGINGAKIDDFELILNGLARKINPKAVMTEKDVLVHYSKKVVAGLTCDEILGANS